MNDRYQWDEKSGRVRDTRAGAPQGSERDAARPAEGRSFGAAHYAEGGFEPRQTYPALHEGATARGWLAKVKDEVGAMLGDHEAERRRLQDRELEARKAGLGGDWRGHDDDTAWRDPVSVDEQARRDRAAAPKAHRPGPFRD